MIRFHFDYLSPYAYIAWTQIHALGERHGRSIQPVPTLLAALLAAGQTKGPAEIPAKRVWVFKDSVRTARVLGIPFGPPPTHPFNPLLALRISGLDQPDEERRRAIDALFAATWGRGPGIDSADGVRAVLDAAGLDGAALVERASEAGAKARLRELTDEALANGVFGVPTMRVDGELFWGYDSFAHVERFLRGEDPLNDVDLNAWRDLRASASRA